MNTEVLKRLKNAGLLSEQAPNMGFVPTGSYALNKIISGDYTKGIPIGMITQFHGEASTAKTVFATHILRRHKKKVITLCLWTLKMLTTLSLPSI